MVKYCFREVLTIRNASKADPQKIGESLEAIAELAGGHLTPIAVVEAAKAPRHILHKHFEWDDAKAAQSWRLDQAREIIRSIHVEDDDATDSIPGFISISEKAGTSYRSLADVKRSPDLQAAVLAAAERDLDAFQKRYRTLQDVCSVIRQAQEIVRKKRDKATDSRAEVTA